LTPYATLYRYPNEIDSATTEEAITAIKMAQDILDFVAQRLPILEKAVENRKKNT
jgi:hypothetical protein